MITEDLKCEWLPNLILLDDFNNWNEYHDYLYKIFVRDFIRSRPSFCGKEVKIRINPMYQEYEHGFIHLTEKSTDNSVNINDRQPDLRRCERIEWVRKIIENYKCNKKCAGCTGILYYEFFANSGNAYKRIAIVFLDKRFKVILEERPTCMLLITGYYLFYDNMIRKELKRYRKYQQQKTPLD